MPTYQIKPPTANPVNATQPFFRRNRSQRRLINTISVVMKAGRQNTKTPVGKTCAFRYRRRAFVVATEVKKRANNKQTKEGYITGE